MKNFRFNLENILQIKKFNEEECRMALGLAISLLNEIENKIKQTAQKQHTAASQRYNDTSNLMVWNNYIERLEREIDELLEKAAKAQIVVDEKREIYMEAFREFKALEKLKERKEKEYIKEMENKQSIEVDEMYAARKINELRDN